MSTFKAFVGSTAGLVVTLLGAVLGAYLLVYHFVHAALAIPYLALLACPLMHVMHRGHQHSYRRDRSDQ